MTYFLRISVFFFFCLVTRTSLAAVMSVDLGSEFMKVAIVKPGVPMEIALNKESKRKTPTVVYLPDSGERSFGDQALTNMLRNSKNTFRYLTPLLGLTIDHPLTEAYMKKFPEIQLSSHPQSGLLTTTVGDTVYSIEELVAMLLEAAKIQATEAADQKIKDVVLTVPPFFSQAQRRSLLRAAALAGLNVLQVMNSNTAVALNFGLFRGKENLKEKKTNDTNPMVKNFIFYDMGASHTLATVVSYQMVKVKEFGYVQEHPSLTVKGVGFDPLLGGLDFTLSLRDHLLKVFTDQKKTSMDISQSLRSMGKIFRESTRLKHVLSANTEHFAQIESLIDDKDFKAKITREEFETINAEFLDHAMRPLYDALKSSQIPLEDIEEIILMGGSSRIPSIQSKLLEACKGVKATELGKSINADEAGALGAVYQAAGHSTGFRVKKFIVKDANLFPITVDFDRQLEVKQAEPSTVKRMLFPHMNVFPQKKIMTFNKHFDDFYFNITYGDINFLTEKYSNLLITNREKPNLIKTIHVAGVRDGYSKNMKEKDNSTVSKGIKAHFELDHNGLFHVNSVEFLFEKTEYQVNANDSESTLSKIGNTISNFFSSSNTTEEEVPKEAVNATSTNTTVNATSPLPASGGKATVPVVKIIRENLTVSQNIQDLVAEPGEDENKDARKRLELLRLADELRARKARARNDLESFIFESLDKLTQPHYQEFATEKEQEDYNSKLSQANDWLAEQDEESTDPEQYEKRLDDLKALQKDFFDRVREGEFRPQALSDLKNLLNQSDTFYSGLQLLSANHSDMFTSVEIKTMQNVINTTYLWRDQVLADQEKQKLHEKPVFTVRDVVDKMRNLDREMKYLLNKAKYYVPPTTTMTPKPEAAKNETAEKTNKTTPEAEREAKTSSHSSTTTTKPPTTEGAKGGHDPDDEL